MKQGLKILIVILILIGIGYAGYSYYSSQEEDKMAANVEIVDTSRADIKATVSATGVIRPVNSVEVSSKVTARIKEVLVKENDHVTAGQVVALLDGKDYEAKREQAEYKVSNTKSKFNRTEYLYSIGAKSQQDYEDASFDYDTAQTNLNQTESDLAEMTIVAPMDGIVVGEPKTPGTMAVQGNSNPTVIMTIADLSSKQILAKVDETDIGSVKVGQKATFTVDTYTDKTFTAVVSKIAQTDVSNSWNINSSSGSSASSSNSVVYYYVILDVVDPDNMLLPAMTARLEIITDEKQNALVIPIKAMRTDANGNYVMVQTSDTKDNKDKADKNGEKRYIKTGLFSDDKVEVVDGLQEGDKLVIANKPKADKNFGPPH